ncbi:MAG: ubiquitin-like protein Pup [Candidatus Saccharimonadales bacterium]
MSSHEQQSSSSSHETETYSDTEMSPEATAEAIAIANQQERIEDITSDTDDLLDDIDKYLENDELVKAFIQQGGQ